MQMVRRLVAAAVVVVAALVGPATSAASAATTSGWNDWSCRPSAQHPRPIVLAHGLGANGTTNWVSLAPKLSAAGYCVFSTTYGGTVLGDAVAGLGPMEKSAATFGAFVDKVRSATGSAKVDVVGHSEGSTVPAYYLKFLGGAAKVDTFIAFGSNYRGTSLSGLGTLARVLGFQPVLNGVGCQACSQFLEGSAFLAELNRGGVAMPGPRYVNVVTKYDTVVTPYTSGFIDGPNVTNVVLQDVCRFDSAGHLGLAFDPNVANLVKHHLDPTRVPMARCVPFTTIGI